MKEPLIASWDDLGKLRPPRELLTLDVDEVNAFCRQSDCYVIQGTCARPFERIQFLRGSENLFLDLAGPPAELNVLIELVHSLYCEELLIWASTDVDALFFMDDWGSQQSLLISPDMWRRIFKPLYREYIEIAHSRGKAIFMHSDGFILDIIPDLIELGLDAVNSQIFCMGLDALTVFRGKICFWGEVDRQHLLPRATEAEIRQSVRTAYDHLYQNGGVIAQCEFGAGARPENVYAVFESWNEITGG